MRCERRAAGGRVSEKVLITLKKMQNEGHCCEDAMPAAIFGTKGTNEGKNQHAEDCRAERWKAPGPFDAVTEPLNSPTLEMPYTSCYFEIKKIPFFFKLFLLLAAESIPTNRLTRKEGNFLVLNQVL